MCNIGSSEVWWARLCWETSTRRRSVRWWTITGPRCIDLVSRLFLIGSRGLEITDLPLSEIFKMNQVVRKRIAHGTVNLVVEITRVIHSSPFPGPPSRSPYFASLLPKNITALWSWTWGFKWLCQVTKTQFPTFLPLCEGFHHHMKKQAQKITPWTNGCSKISAEDGLLCNEISIQNAIFWIPVAKWNRLLFSSWDIRRSMGAALFLWAILNHYESVRRTYQKNSEHKAMSELSDARGVQLPGCST